MAKDNKSLGKFHLVGIPPALHAVSHKSRSHSTLTPTAFLNVNAKDRGTGKESRRSRITASSGLSDGEIDNMVSDAESHAEEDRQRERKRD